jgi:hypothetical protein
VGGIDVQRLMIGICLDVGGMKVELRFEGGGTPGGCDVCRGLSLDS